MRRRVGVAALVWLAVVAMPTTALAAWGGSGSGSGSSLALSMPGGSAPAASASGHSVSLSWSPATFPGGTPVAGYRVTRYDAALTPTAAGGACGGTVTTSSCTENGVPSGIWTYTIVPRQGAWSGAESSCSAPVSVGGPSLSFSPNPTIASLPATRSGAVAGFLGGDTLTFRLDDAASGTVLSGSTTPSPIPTDGQAAVAVTIPAGTSDGAHTVYAVGSSGTTAGASIVVDTTAPVVTSTIARTTGASAGFIRQGQTYYVYANVADATSSVASVSANVANVTAGQTAVALTAGTFTYAGVSYGYRSAQLTADATLAAGTKAYAITARDQPGNAGTTTWSVVVDNTAPSPSDVQTTNVGGGTSGHAETGDTITFTFTEPIDPDSVLAGWLGSPTPVTIRLVNGTPRDSFQVYSADNVTPLALGSVRLGTNRYVTATRTFSGSTMVLSGSTITITLGTPSGATGTVTTSGTMTWTPISGLTDRAGNACTTTPVDETGLADIDF